MKAKVKSVKSASNVISLRQGASFVQSIIYLIKDRNRLRNSIALSFGILFGGFYPVVSFILFHFGIQQAFKEGRFLKAFVYVVIGMSGLVVSLNNVQDQIRQMLRTQSNLPWFYAVLLEGAAMFVHGSPLEDVSSYVALTAIIICNTVKMTYKSLLPRPYSN